MWKYKQDMEKLKDLKKKKKTPTKRLTDKHATKRMTDKQDTKS